MSKFGAVCDNTRYFRAEFAEGPVSDRPQHPVLQLTTDDVARAAGIAIKAGMVIEHHYDHNGFKVRVLSGPDGDLLADWVSVS